MTVLLLLASAAADMTGRGVEHFNAGCFDEAGMLADFQRLPAKVVARVRRKIGVGATAGLDAGQTARALEAGLSLARGFRRGGSTARRSG